MAFYPVPNDYLSPVDSGAILSLIKENMFFHVNKKLVSGLCYNRGYLLTEIMFIEIVRPPGTWKKTASNLRMPFTNTNYFVLAIHYLLTRTKQSDSFGAVPKVALIQESFGLFT